MEKQLLSYFKFYTWLKAEGERERKYFHSAIVYLETFHLWMQFSIPKPHMNQNKKKLSIPIHCIFYHVIVINSIQWKKKLEFFSLFQISQVCLFWISQVFLFFLQFLGTLFFPQDSYNDVVEESIFCICLCVCVSLDRWKKSGKNSMFFAFQFFSHFNHKMDII